MSNQEIADAAKAAGYPDFDIAFADTMVSTDEVYVEYDTSVTDDKIVIRRTVWRKHNQKRMQKVLWMADVAALSTDQTVGLVRDLAQALVSV